MPNLIDADALLIQIEIMESRMSPTALHGYDSSVSEGFCLVREMIEAMINKNDENII